MKAVRLLLAAAAFVAALPAAAQVAPTRDYTDMWFNPNESGWGISVRQKRPVGGSVDAMFSVWYTYDPRTSDTTTSGAGDFAPLWFVMPGGTWTSPTTYTGGMYVVRGTTFSQAWVSCNTCATLVGSYTFNFTDASNGTFTYAVTPPSGVASTDPAFGLSSFSGVKTITRQPY